MPAGNQWVTLNTGSASGGPTHESRARFLAPFLISFPDSSRRCDPPLRRSKVQSAPKGELRIPFDEILDVLNDTRGDALCLERAYDLGLVLLARVKK